MELRKSFQILICCFLFIMINVVATQETCSVINCKCDTAAKRVYDCVNVTEDILILIAQQINNKTTDLSITGQNLTDFDAPFYLENLINLDLSENSFTRVPSGLAKKFPKLGVLELKDNKIGTIQAEDFTGLSHLNKLRLDRNLLREIKGGTFDELKNLRQLYVGENFIETLSVDSFSGIPNLANLEMNKNRIRNLPVGIFDPLKPNNQLAIELSENLLTEIPNGLFTKLTQLQFFVVEKNRLSRIGDRAFQGVQAMAVNINDNSIPELYASSFKGSRIDILLVTHNPIKCQCDMKDIPSLFSTQIDAKCLNETGSKVDALSWNQNELCNKCEVNNTCQNGAVCVPIEKTGLNCKCTDDYFGEDCQHQPICNTVTCHHQGVCKNLGPSNYTCECTKKYSGKNCEIFQKGEGLTDAEIVGIVLGVLLFFIFVLLIFIFCKKRMSSGGQNRNEKDKGEKSKNQGENVPLNAEPV